MSKVDESLEVAGAELAPRAGLRVRPRRPIRAVVAAFLVIASVVAVLMVYQRVGDRREVLAVSRTVLAGEQLTDGDLRVVSISTDDDLPVVSASDRELLVGQYARVRMIEGSLLTVESVQPGRLVDPEKVLMSVEVPVGRVPVGLREQSEVTLIVTPPSGSEVEGEVLVSATVSAVPGDLGALVGQSDQSTSLMVPLSVEVDPDDAGVVGTAESVAVGVLDPARTKGGD